MRVWEDPSDVNNRQVIRAAINESVTGLLSLAMMQSIRLVAAVTIVNQRDRLWSLTTWRPWRRRRDPAARWPGRSVFVDLLPRDRALSGRYCPASDTGRRRQLLLTSE